MYGQSPWEEASGSVNNFGNNMAGMVMSQGMARERAWQFMQQMALQKAYLDIAQQKASAEIPEVNATRRLKEFDLHLGKAREHLAQNMGQNAFQASVPNEYRSAPEGTQEMMNSGAMSPQLVAMAVAHAMGNKMGSDPRVYQASFNRDLVNSVGMDKPEALLPLLMGTHIPKESMRVMPLTGETIHPPSAPVTDYQRQMLQILSERNKINSQRVGAYGDSVKNAMARTLGGNDGLLMDDETKSNLMSRFNGNMGQVQQPPQIENTLSPVDGIPQQAIQYLMQHPELREHFDMKYGQGAAASILGQ